MDIYPDGLDDIYGFDDELVDILAKPEENRLPFEPEYAKDPDLGVRCEWTGTLFTPIAGERERLEASRKAEVTMEKAPALWVPMPVAMKDSPKRVKMDPLTGVRVRAK